ncbi:G-protein coupled receptor moody-like [Lytechinus variegatus]|uniref:G-protein coupled receptor moody-like n=1 Tax=Lytechinus variegatus TaxID=7654 RepID=UPI001BB299F1|nr:G-protein coupled receptor moody-like [Lytechinus variegatus]
MEQFYQPLHPMGQSLNHVNVSQGGTEGAEFEFSTASHRVLLASLLLVISIVSFLGNALVILAVGLSRRLQTTTNVFVINLAVADIAITVLLWFHVATLLTFQGMPFAELLCMAVAALSLICLGTSALSLTLIAFNRYFLITHKPTSYIKIYTPLNIIFMVIFSWVYPVLIIIIGTQTGLGDLGYSHKYKVCTQDTSHENADYLSLLGGLSVLTPAVLLILACYAKIYYHVTSHNRQLYRSRSIDGMSDITCTTGAVSPDQRRLSRSPHQMGDPVSHNESSANSNDYENQNGTVNGMATVLSLEKKRAKKVRRQQVEITKNLFLVICAFLLCVLPATIGSLIPSSDPAIPWITLILVFNSCINPFIYASRHPNFKTVFKSILSCRLASVPEGSWRTKRSRSRFSRQRSFRV